MKYATILSMAIAALTLAACESTQTKSAMHGDTAHGHDVAAPPMDMSKRDKIQPDVTLIAHGMSCPLCATNLDKQMLKIEGVNEVFVDLSTGEIIVDVDEQNRPSNETLADAVRESGFTLVSVQSNEAKEGATP